MTDDLEELLDEHDAPASKKMSGTQLVVIIVVALLILALPVIMVLGVVFWQIGIFHTPTMTVTATGFAKLKPQLAGTGFISDGRFYGVFTNGVGTHVNISVDSITVVDDSGGRCGPASLRGDSYVSAGSNFMVEASGCPAIDQGDYYDIRVTIPYAVSIGGVTTNHEEIGTVRGPAE